MKKTFSLFFLVSLIFGVTASVPETQYYTDSEEDIATLSEGMSTQDKENLMEQIAELRAYQAAFEIVSKSFGATNLDDHLNKTSRYVIENERIQKLKNMIWNCSDENVIKKELETCKLLSEEEMISRLFTIEHHCSFTIYALDGLADNIRLKEDKKFYAEWLLYLEKTSKKIKKNLELLANERFQKKP